MIKDIIKEEKLMERFRSLPKTLREAISSIETADNIQEIGEKYKLHIDQVGKLGSETGLVMLGFTRPYLFPAKVAQALNIPREEASKIAQDINDKIFSQIREFIQSPISENIDLKNKPDTQIFKEKMTGLFQTTSEQASTSPQHSRPGDVDPYNEPVE